MLEREKTEQEKQFTLKNNLGNVNDPVKETFEQYKQRFYAF